MMQTSGLVIYMVVYNHFENDSRVRKEAVTLAEAGHAVTIIALWKPGLLQEQKIGDVRVIRLKNIPLHILVLGQKNFDRLKTLIYGPSGPHRQLFPGGTPRVGVQSVAGPGRSGVSRDKKKSAWRNLLQFGFSTAKKIVFTFGFYRKIARFFSQKVIMADVFHAHDLNTLYICHRMAKKYKAKLVYDSHELFVFRNRPYHPPGWFLALETWFEKRYIKKADAVITVSHSIAAYLEQTHGICRPHLIMNAPHRVHDNPEQKKYLLREALHISENHKILLYAGGITFGRGLAAVIKSLAVCENIFFVMMGPGFLQFKADLAAVAQQAGVGDRVAFFGPVPYEQVTGYCASADIGIAPIENVCLSYYFCAPNKVFEYIQGGIPVVASNFPDLLRIVETNRIGLTCDTADPLAIASAVQQVLDDYPFYVQQIKKIRHRFCWENESRILEQIYQQVSG